MAKSTALRARESPSRRTITKGRLGDGSGRPSARRNARTYCTGSARHAFSSRGARETFRRGRRETRRSRASGSPPAARSGSRRGPARSGPPRGDRPDARRRARRTRNPPPGNSSLAILDDRVPVAEGKGIRPHEVEPGTLAIPVEHACALQSRGEDLRVAPVVGHDLRDAVCRSGELRGSSDPGRCPAGRARSPRGRPAA